MDYSGKSDESILLLAQYEWIYNFQLTNFFVDRVWEKIPEEWISPLLNLSYDELSELPFNFIKHSWPSSLTDFLAKSRQPLIPREQDVSVQPSIIDNFVKRGMGPKKVHEVSYLSGRVAEICERTSCGIIMDVGSGLGYLGQVLSQNFGLKVIGLESVDTRTHGADCRVSKQKLEKQDVLIETHTVELVDTPQCRKQFSELLNQIIDTSKPSPLCKACPQSEQTISEQSKINNSDCSSITASRPNHPDCLCKCGRSEKFWSTASKTNSKKVCMVGLHCCGDLTPTMLRYFVTVNELETLVCVSCCYHGMKVSDSGGFHNFPMSKSMISSVAATQKSYPGWELTVYALRLAAQETRSRWRTQTDKDHEYHMRNVAYRSLLELGLKTTNCGLKKLRRKVARKSDFDTFQCYLNAVCERAEVAGDLVVIQRNKTAFIEMMHKVYQDYEKYFVYIEIITALQYILQPVIESLIIQDRVQFLKESGVEQSYSIPVFNDAISPRNIAIISTKSPAM